MPDGLPDVPAEMVESIGDAIEGVTPEVAPVDPTNLQTPEAPATPEGQVSEEAATEAPDSFTKLDPNAIPEDLQPYYKAMQADYTRKQQEAAPWRKLGEELGIDSPDSFREAAELYSYLQDPNNLHLLYSSLGNVLGQGGQPQAPAPATEYAQQLPQGVDEEFASLEDPAVAQLKQQVDALQGYIQERDAAQQQEALQWALLGEMNRQEALLKEQHPDWGDEEWGALWNLSVAYNGDLVAASNHIEAAQNAAVTRLLNGKAQAAATPGLTPEAPPRVAAVAETPDHSDPELRNETAQAIEYLRGVANLSE